MEPQMHQLELITFVATIVVLQMAIILYAWDFISGATRTQPGIAARLAFPALLIAWLMLTIALTTRAAVTGHAPFTNMYEFASSFGWGVMASALLFQWRLKARVFGAGGAVIAFVLLAYTFTLPSQYEPLPAALRQTWLLPLHVSCAVMAYGMFALGFVSAILYLIREKVKLSFLPEAEMPDRAGYLAVVTGFPLMTLVIVIGSIWAKVAWGTYWNWDPKETASLVTWFIYAGYLFTRLFLHWKNRRSAIFLIIGFAAVLVTFFGNLFFGGLHSYAAP
jgi:cytochrome c-type biogenesis protein CcsB